jgi:hypothetical protein
MVCGVPRHNAHRVLCPAALRMREDPFGLGLVHQVLEVLHLLLGILARLYEGRYYSLGCEWKKKPLLNVVMDGRRTTHQGRMKGNRIMKPTVAAVCDGPHHPRDSVTEPPTL